ncbi:MmgE/PrpD family protein [Chloroflexota bacterium]
MENIRISGEKALEAYVIGFEVGSRIGSGLTRHYALGWHTTATVGTMVAAAAAAKVLDLDVHQTKMVLGIAQLITCGVFDLEKMDRGLGSSFDIISPGGISLKLYSSCYLSQWCIDAMFHLIKEYNTKAGDIDEVIYQLPSAMAQTLRYPYPKTALEAIFSMGYCMAAALLDGEVSPKVFTDKKIKRPVAQEIINKVKCIPTNPDMDLTEALQQPHTVTVKLKNKKEYSHNVTFPRGDIRNLMSDEEIEAKFRECASPIFNPKQIACVLELGWRLESLPLLSELTHALLGSEKS